MNLARGWAWVTGAAAVAGSLAFLVNSSIVFHDAFAYSQLPILYRVGIERLRAGDPVESLAPEERQTLLVESFRGSFASLQELSERHDGKGPDALLRDVALDAFEERHGASFWGPAGYRERQVAWFAMGFLAFVPYAALALIGRLRGGRRLGARADWE